MIRPPLTRLAPISRRAALSFSAAAALSRPGLAQQPTIRIGVLTDQSGPYKDFGGPGAIAAVRQAVRDFGDHGSRSR
jgi:branched-chain amino acid transport system substrate-binding protein